MEQSIEQQLIEALTKSTPFSSSAGDRYSIVESLFAELIGGQQQGGRGALRGPDILIRRGGATPVAIELKISVSAFRKNLNNRVADLLAAAVESRRSFRAGVTLSAVILLADPTAGPDKQDELASAMAVRLLRSDDGVGYDSVFFGFVDAELHWQYFSAQSSADSRQMVNTAEMLHFLRSQEPAAPSEPAQQPLNRQLRILMVADEWRSGRGGISTVNRELAVALVSADVDVAVLVPATSDEDMRAASEANVALVTPARVPGLNDREALLLRPVFAEKGWEPDVVVGHGRLLGPYAAVQQQQYFPKARRVHFVHTDAEQLEAAKEVLGGSSNMLTAEVRRRLERALARSADLVVGIGPLLAETIRDELIGTGPTASVVSLIPGLRTAFDLSTVQPPVQNRILIVGRADDFQSKGIDIAAEALLKVADRWPASRMHQPVLVIRGVPDESATDAKQRLDAIFEGRVKYSLRPYSDSEAEVKNDLAQARMLLMPSRHEGFGLAAWEAIGSGIPVLISAESGLAQFLFSSEIDTSPSSIVSTRNSSAYFAIDQWASAIQHVLDSPESARAQAHELRRALSDRVNWEQAVAALLATLSSPHDAS